MAIWDALGDMYDLLYPTTAEDLAIAHIDWDDTPVLANISEAWYFGRDGEWHRTDCPMTYDGYVVSPEVFHEMFGKLRPLPPEAFGGNPKFKLYPRRQS